jgi:CubicO group peptidase (beta-lactamase class C family)
MHRLVFVLAIPLLFPAGPSRLLARMTDAPPFSASPEACPPDSSPAAARLETLVEAVRSDDFDAILRGLRAAWATDGDRKDDLDAAIVNLGQWSVLSDGLAAESMSAEGATVAVGEYRNALTGAIDRLRLEVQDAPDHRVTEVRVTYAVRLAEPVPSAFTDAERVRILDDYVSSLAANNVFSGVVLVAHHGTPIYTRAFGQERGVPIRETTQFNLASMNKMFTAVSIMQLVEKGDLSLDDSLGELLPEEFGEGDAARVRVEHLLSHTSGFSMYGPTFVFTPPGSSFAYANYGFLVLGEIIEAKTQMRYEDYVQLKIFGPLEMANTARYDLEELSPHVTWGYYYPIPAVDDRLERIPNKYLHIYTGGPMGGMYSTAPDLLKFANALREGRLVRLETLDLMKAPKPQLGAPEYGFGVMLWQAPGVWGHSGRLPGADADLEFYDNDYTGIVLANYDNVNLPVLRTMRALFQHR